ncbi:MAG: cob(I)yrinic acid a,c-diamide adenosyltransferase [Candidatus Hydrogenedentota bacterium]|nr:MAG: cob(I)yrinic acid a,c-diamide adenosyltransferase [Candidatus Hydrogenedentota bacterium]
MLKKEKARRDMKFFNKKGDRGTTSLLFGHRVPKYSPRPEAYGVIDEANSALGLARALVHDQKLKRVILNIQEELFLVGSELAALPDETSKLRTRVSEAHTLRLEKLIGEYEKLSKMPTAFVPPGATPGAGALDLARSIIRRAERRIAKLFDEGEVRNPELLRYCNRLADLLFTLARYEGVNESPTDEESDQGAL